MRCVVIDGTPIYLMGFRSLLEASFPHWKVSTAGSLKEGSRKIYEAPRDRLGIVILDQYLCAECDGEFIPRIRAMPNPHPVGIVLLGNAAERNDALHELWGIDAFVDRQSSPDEVVQTVASAAGTHAPEASTAERLPFSCPAISDRQRDLLDLLRQGYSNKQMANALRLTCGTVKNYMMTLMRQFNVRSRLELVAKLNDVSLQRDERVLSRTGTGATAQVTRDHTTERLKVERTHLS